jgi:hypothetical protein
MKQYTKPSVREGHWWTRVEGMTKQGEIINIAMQVIDGTWQDHYAIYINGKRQRKTYFGESAHHEVARAYNDLVGWQNTIFGDEL